jgi:hypothetical protein
MKCAGMACRQSGIRDLARSSTSVTAPHKVIYITGYGRSGSTLLDIALGSHPRIFGAGEITALARHVWDNGEYCACGAQVRDCAFWRPIVESWLGETADQGQTLLAFADRQRRLEGLVSWRRLAGRRFVPWLAGHLQQVGALFGRIAAQLGAKNPIIVDSSKLPGRGFVLAATPDIDLFVVHLVRDARAVAWSLSKPHSRSIEEGVQRELHPKPAAYVALRWTIVNLAAELLRLRVGKKRSMRLRYEDFVADPAAALKDIASMCGAGWSEVADTAARSPLDPAHQVAGSRHRTNRALQIRVDEEWRWQMPEGKFRLVTVLSAPLLRRYGYPLTAARKQESARALRAEA